MIIPNRRAPAPRGARGCESRWGQGGCIINEQGHILELAHGSAQLGPVLLLQLTVTDAGLVDAADGGQHPNNQRIRGHLHAEHQDGLLLVQNGVLHQVHGETGLAHGRPAGHDHQVRGLQSGGHAVQVRKAGAQAGDFAAGVEQFLDALQRAFQQWVHILRATRLGALLGNLHDAGARPHRSVRRRCAPRG